MSEVVHRGQKTAMCHLELKLQEFVSHQTWVLGTKPRSSARQAVLFVLLFVCLFFKRGRGRGRGRGAEAEAEEAEAEGQRQRQRQRQRQAGSGSSSQSGLDSEPVAKRGEEH